MYVKPGYSSKKPNIFLKIAYVLAILVMIITIALAASYYYAYTQLNNLTETTQIIKVESETLQQKTLELEKEIESSKRKKEDLEKDLLLIKPIEIPEGFMDEQ